MQIYSNPFSVHDIILKKYGWWPQKAKMKMNLWHYWLGVHIFGPITENKQQWFWWLPSVICTWCVPLASGWYEHAKAPLLVKARVCAVMSMWWVHNEEYCQLWYFCLLCKSDKKDHEERNMCFIIRTTASSSSLVVLCFPQGSSGRDGSPSQMYKTVLGLSPKNIVWNIVNWFECKVL